MADTSFAAPLIPRLSVKHLLLCTAVCALIFGRAPGALADASLLRIFYIIVGGCAITSAIVVIYVCRTTPAWKATDPGHWFALVRLWEFLEAAIVSKFLYYVTGAVDERNVWQASPATEGLLTSIAYIGIAAILIVGICITKWPLYWRVAAGIHLLDAINAAIWRLSSVSDNLRFAHVPDTIYLKLLPIFGVLAIIALVVATVIDVTRKELRNWPHWTGLLDELLHWISIVRAYG